MATSTDAKPNHPQVRADARRSSDHPVLVQLMMIDITTAVHTIRCPIISMGAAGVSSGKNAGNNPHNT